MPRALVAVLCVGLFTLLAGAAEAVLASDADAVRLVVECEDMQGVAWGPEGFTPVWTAGRWGRDLHQNMIFGGTWASRMAAAVTDAGDEPAEVTQEIEVPRAGRYKVWAKYECPPFFNYPFAIRLTAAGQNQPIFDKTYGLRSSPKHFCFTDKVAAGDQYWAWGIDHDAAEGYEVELQPGRYTLTLAKVRNPDPSSGLTGARSVDVILITSRLSETSAPDFPRYPLLDELMKANRVLLRYTNTGPTPITISQTHWSHRYNHFYAPDPSKLRLVRFYDADGQVLQDDAGQPLSSADGQWKQPIAPGQSSPWIDWGPTLVVESASPVTASATAVDDAGAPLAPQPAELPFRLDLALAPGEGSLVKSFTSEPGLSFVAVQVQPDLHRPEGRDWTVTTMEIYRRMTAELEQYPRVGPLPRRLRLMASVGTPWWGQKAPVQANGLTRDRQASVDYAIALGLNTTDVAHFDTFTYDAVAAYYAARGLPFIELAGRYHHTQNVADIEKMLLKPYPNPGNEATTPDPKARARLYYVSFGDEIGLPAVDLKDEQMLGEFRAYLRRHRVRAEEIGLRSLDDAKPLSAYSASAAVRVGLMPEPAAGDERPQLPTGEAGQALRRLFWHSHQFTIERGIADFAAKTAAMTAAVGPHFKTTANLGGMHPFYWVHQSSFIEAFKGQAMTLAWSEDYDYTQPEGSRLSVDFLAAYLRAGAKYHDTPMQFYNMPHYPGNSGTHLIHNAALLWGQGIKDLDFFVAGPDIYSTENYIHSRGGVPETGRAIRLISGMAGNVEDALLPARPRPARVALLLSEASDVWELQAQGQWSVTPDSQATNVSQEERKAIWYCLRNHGYQADLLTEHDVQDGRLKDYRVLYVNGHNLERRTAPVLAEWVAAGGQLFLTVGAARKDQFDEPFTGLDAVVGRGAVTQADYYEGPLRAKMELLFLEPMDQAILSGRRGSDAPEARVPAADQPYPVYASRELFAPAPGATQVRLFASVSPPAPAAVWAQVGSGRGYYTGTLPGQAYLRHGMKVQPMGKGGPERATSHYEPMEFDRAAEALILAPVREAKLAPEAAADKPGVNCTVLDGPGATVVTVINRGYQHTGKLQNVTITLPGARPAKAVRTAMKASATARHAGDGVVVTLPVLDEADVVVIEH